MLWTFQNRITGRDAGEITRSGERGSGGTIAGCSLARRSTALKRYCTGRVTVKTDSGDGKDVMLAAVLEDETFSEAIIGEWKSYTGKAITDGEHRSAVRPRPAMVTS